MHTTNQLLDELSEKHSGATDYRLSKLLNTSTQTVSNWRRGRSSLSVEFAHRIAALLEWEPAYVVACVEWERAARESTDALEQTGEILNTWQKIAEKFRPTLPGILLGAVGLFTATDSHAHSLTYHASADFCNVAVLYIMRTSSRRRRRFRHRFRVSIQPNWSAFGSCLFRCLIRFPLRRR
jgi:transcriptional regulator with XRE-family HTH domain